VGTGKNAWYFIFDSVYLEDLKAGKPRSWYSTYAEKESQNLKAILSHICLQTPVRTYHG